MLSDNRPCESLGNSAKTTLLDEEGFPVIEEDEDTGRLHTVCEIVQTGAIISDCTMACSDPFARFIKDPSREGWWYDPTSDINGDTLPDRRLLLEGVAPEPGSAVRIECCL